MNRSEMVTDFKLEDADGSPVRLIKLLRALQDHLNAIPETKLDGETFSCLVAWEEPGARLPLRFRWLIAFHVEGENEADYVHVGAIIQREGNTPTEYLDFGFAKLWNGPAHARAVANEASRFLAAARWN